MNLVQAAFGKQETHMLLQLLAMAERICQLIDNMLLFLCKCVRIGRINCREIAILHRIYFIADSNSFSFVINFIKQQTVHHFKFRRKFFNSIVTFLVSGLWHGIHYLLWGLINGIFVSVGERLKTRWTLLNQAVTFLLVTLLWSFFVWPNTQTAVSMVASVFTTFNYGSFWETVGSLGLTLGDWIVLGLAVVALWLADVKMSALRSRFRSFAPPARVAVICVLGLLVLVFGMYGIGFTASEFIYSRF